LAAGCLQPGCAGRLVEDAANLELLVREDVALQQLVLAALGSNSLVVEQAVKVMAAAGSYAGAARRLVRHNVVQAITDLVASKDMVRCLLHGGWWRCMLRAASRAQVLDSSSQGFAKLLAVMQC
jgi:hypothetical protein